MRLDGLGRRVESEGRNLKGPECGYFEPCGSHFCQGDLVTRDDIRSHEVANCLYMFISTLLPFEDAVEALRRLVRGRRIAPAALPLRCHSFCFPSIFLRTARVRLCKRSVSGASTFRSWCAARLPTVARYHEIGVRETTEVPQAERLVPLRRFRQTERVAICWP